MTATKKRQIKQSPKLPAEARREQLLMAAHNLFDRKGFRATTLDEIAEAVGLTKGAVYHHFRNKEAILLALTRLIIGSYQDAVRNLPEGSLQPSDLIRHLTKVDEEVAMNRVRHNGSLLAEILQVPKVRKTIDDGYDEYLRLCTQALDPSLARNRQELRQLAILTSSYYDGLCWGRFMHYSHIDFEIQTSLFARYFDVPKGTGKQARRGV